MRDWLDMKQTTVELRTFVSYKSAVEKFIIPYFDKKHPGLKLSQITANIYVHQEFVSKINSANAILQVLPVTQKEAVQAL